MVSAGWTAPLTVGLFALVVTLSAAEAEITPAKNRSSSFAISKRASASILPIGAKDLIDDQTFLATLTKVLDDPKFSGADKADAFFLMLRKIGWDFTGRARIPPGFSYFRTYTGTVATLLQYQMYFEEHPHGAAELLQIASSQCSAHVVRCSHALLLATVLDRKASAHTLKSLADPSVVRKAQVPDILIHYLSMAAVLSGDFAIATAVGSLLDVVQGEESQEDLLCSLGMFQSSDTTGLTERFLRSALETKLDSAVETGLLVFRQQLRDPEMFKARYDELVLTVSDPARSTHLLNLQRENFSSLNNFAAGAGWIKIWDDVDVAIYDDGMVLSYRTTFRDFIAPQP